MIFSVLIIQMLFLSTTLMAEQSPEKKIDKKPLVQVLKVELKPYSEKSIYPSSVVSNIYSSVTSDTEGEVTKIIKPLGSRVEKGQTILVIENKDPVYTFAAISVKAPIAGVVSDIHVSLLSKVNRHDKLFSITDTRQLKLKAEIPAQDLKSIKIGDLGVFKSQYDSTDEIKIAVQAISPIVDPNTGTASAEFKFLDTKNLPSVGTLGQVEFNTNLKNMITVPEAALTYKEGKPYLRLLQNGKVVKKSIQLGLQNNDSFEVKSGISNGETIIVKSNKFIKDGDEVEIETENKVE